MRVERRSEWKKHDTRERKTDIEQQGRREYVMKSERGIKTKFIEKKRSIILYIYI